MLNICPQCESKAIKRNGYTRHGKQNHRCLDCGRQFSLEPVLEDEQTEAQSKMEKFVCCDHL
jgi:transposase-like protein